MATVHVGWIRMVSAAHVSASTNWKLSDRRRKSGVRNRRTDGVRGTGSTEEEVEMPSGAPVGEMGSVCGPIADPDGPLAGLERAGLAADGEAACGEAGLAGRAASGDATGDHAISGGPTDSDASSDDGDNGRLKLRQGQTVRLHSLQHERYVFGSTTATVTTATPTCSRPWGSRRAPRAAAGQWEGSSLPQGD